MKTIFAYILTLAFVLNAGGKIFIYLDFLINQDYIAKNLCENKDKPVLKCNGKCHLAKELAKEEKKEKKETKQKFEDTNNYYFCSLENVMELNTVYFEKREHTHATIQAKLVGYVAKVFHPPTLSYSHFVA